MYTRVLPFWALVQPNKSRESVYYNDAIWFQNFADSAAFCRKKSYCTTQQRGGKNHAGISYSASSSYFFFEENIVPRHKYVLKRPLSHFQSRFRFLFSREMHENIAAAADRILLFSSNTCTCNFEYSILS